MPALVNAIFLTLIFKFIKKLQVKSLEILIKPASSNCNLSCKYCFYLDECNKRSIADYGFMSRETAHSIINKAFDIVSDEIFFTFQGGEPLLLGLDFYKDFVSYAKTKAKLKASRFNLNFSIQTNGTLIDESWANFLKKENFLVGISLDGPKEMHDFYRGQGSFEKVLLGLEKLQDAGVKPNVLCVLTNKNCEEENCGENLYKFFKTLGFSVMQFIPCLDALADKGTKIFNKYEDLKNNKNCDCFPKDFAAAKSLAKENSMPRQSALSSSVISGENKSEDLQVPSLSADNFGNFLSGSFLAWQEDQRRGENISIRYFENLARILSCEEPETCTLCGRCKLGITIEADGSAFPCDFYAVDEWLLGNINSDSIEKLASCQRANEFVRMQAVHTDCKACNFYKLCKGGCRREKLFGKTKFCEGYKSFFEFLIGQTKRN